MTAPRGTETRLFINGTEVECNSIAWKAHNDWGNGKAYQSEPMTKARAAEIRVRMTVPPQTPPEDWLVEMDHPMANAAIELIRQLRAELERHQNAAELQRRTLWGQGRQ